MPELENYCVYAHILKKDGRMYIGKALQNISKNGNLNRWGHNGHGYSAQIFGRAIAKYGWNAFEHIIILKNLTRTAAARIERELIQKLETQKKDKGFNVADGGEGCSKKIYTDEEIRLRGNECKKRWRKHNKERQKEYNKKYYDEHYIHKPKNLEKISEIHRKKVMQKSTGLIFKSCREAGRYYGKSDSWVTITIKNAKKNHKECDWIYVD